MYVLLNGTQELQFSTQGSSQEGFFKIGEKKKGKKGVKVVIIF